MPPHTRGSASSRACCVPPWRPRAIPFPILHQCWKRQELLPQIGAVPSQPSQMGGRVRVRGFTDRPTSLQEAVYTLQAFTQSQKLWPQARVKANRRKRPADSMLLREPLPRAAQRHSRPPEGKERLSTDCMSRDQYRDQYRPVGRCRNGETHPKGEISVLKQHLFETPVSQRPPLLPEGGRERPLSPLPAPSSTIGLSSFQWSRVPQPLLIKSINQSSQPRDKSRASMDGPKGVQQVH